MFGIGHDAVCPSNIYVFDKADLYAGGDGNYTMLTTPVFNIVPGASYDSTSTTMYLVANYFRNFSGNAYIRTYTLTGSIGAEVLTSGPLSSTTAVWADAYGDFYPQLGSTDLIYAGTGESDRFQKLFFCLP
jgi:hypothetical protein